MISKLQSFYPKAIQKKHPSTTKSQHFHWLQDPLTDQWIGIPIQDLSDSELNLLKALFPYKSFDFNRSIKAKVWYEFLFSKGDLPQLKNKKQYRAIYFTCKMNENERYDFENAFQGFFPEEIIIIWENEHTGIILEKMGSQTVSKEELISIIDTLTSDFYINIKMYIGKFRDINNTFRTHFKIENHFFKTGMKFLQTERVLTFERILPTLLLISIPQELQRMLIYEYNDILSSKDELLHTVKTYIENYFNASLTAKKLYIHRNTLQYRLEKFTKKTGITFEDFHDAIAIFLAAILYPLVEK
ncbi:helix-turn-helix domain-containing protein [Bacillus aquiflavi]|uniref:PucR family transcriptional regulator n=1 Tax=Bacillus aquiflavi TaxID=2672567 RepID=UPI001CA880E4|nr:helix-turn-helix domain-containing protein [Bacillus aquiflavi]UAC48951.1 helix-turn-helix domain-containing protein [Bacillus aquiflavi]